MSDRTAYPVAVDAKATDLRIRRAMGRMPYGAGITPDLTVAITLDDVAVYLEKLADRLTEAGDDHRRRDNELTDFRDAARGFGRLLELAANEAAR